MTAREVLQELVACADLLRELNDSRARDPDVKSPRSIDLERDYDMRASSAWNAARAYLAQPEPQDEAVDRMRQELRRAQIKLRDREHKADMSTHEPAEVLATLGFWPECGCGECYAIFCLEQTLAKYHTALAAQDKENEK